MLMSTTIETTACEEIISVRLNLMKKCLCYTTLNANVTMYQLNGRKTIIKTVKVVSVNESVDAFTSKHSFKVLLG